VNPFRYEFYSVFQDVLKSDRTAPEIKNNQTFQEFLGQKPELLTEYVDTYRMFVKMVAKDIIPLIDLTNSRKVIEVGGRDGTFLAELTKVYSDFTGAFFDQTLYRNFVERTVTEYNIRDRIKILSGNFVDSVPEGFDTVILKAPISEYNDENLEKILRNCRKAVMPGNKLWMTDHLIDRHDAEALKFVSQLDILDLVFSNGKLRSKQELEPIFERSGFRIENYTLVRKLWVIEATAL